MKKVKLSISGIHCGSCAGNIERSLKKVPGVKEVSVSAVTNKAFVEADEKATEEEMKKAVSRAGYKVVEIEEN
jgi:Cu+-exporting ATPase